MSSEPEPKPEPHKTAENWYRQQLGRVGLGIFIVGLACGLYFSVLVFRAQVAGIYSLPMYDFVPFEWLGINLDCPVLLTKTGTGTITTVVENPFQEALGYTAHVAAYQNAEFKRSGGPVYVSGPEGARAASFFGDDTLATSGTIPANEVAKVIWKVGVTDRRGDVISVRVYVNTGRILYMDSCKIVLANLSGLTGRQVVGLIWLSMPFGGLLWLCGRAPLRCRGYVGLAIGGLLWLFIMWMLGGFSLILSI